MCFFWGVPYFFLAFLAWFSGCIAFGSALISKKVATFGLLGVLIFGTSCAYFAWKDIVTPEPITAHDLDRLTDDAFAVIAILRSSFETHDAEAAIGNMRAKSHVREELSRYDTARIDAIDAIVGRYLRYQRSLEKDLIAFIAEQSKGEHREFSASPATLAALAELPDRIRATFGAKGEDLNDLTQVFGTHVLERLPENWRHLCALALKTQWNQYAVTYEDLMKRPLPIDVDIELQPETETPTPEANIVF
jgi:hypothetical protein